MKNKFEILTGLLIVAGFVAMAFSGGESFKTGEYYRYTKSNDTITNAANDTLLLPVTFYSRFTYLAQIGRTNISGTTNVKLYLQQANTTSGNTDWVTVDSTTTTGASIGVLDGDEALGIRYRFIVDGTGTQSTRYFFNVTMKRKQ
jgi:hypothetical protein